MNIERLSRTKAFEGWVEFYRHRSECTGTEMRFSIFLPPQAATAKVPLLYWLSGLTCTEENFMVKSGAHAFLAEHGVALVACDTSPRGAAVPGEDADWDLGTGAGFYVNATQPKWARHYRMFDYVTRELPELVKANFPVLGDRESIFGHSMGGHGALISALRQPGRYRSVSAFAPISAPSLCPWGKKAFSAYLGDDLKAWAAWDTHLLVRAARVRIPFLIDQGTEDKFLSEQLMPHVLQETCLDAGYPLDLRMREGYDHSYYFISTFIHEHIAYHAKALKS
jgi:S-formylglutathione hydrolase